LEQALKRRKAKSGGRKIKAVLPVHLYGHPAEMDSILEIARRYGLVVIEDAAQAHGATYGGKRVGSLGVLACFSFYPTKNLGGYGDGGMVVTDKQSYYKKLKLLRCYGEREKYHHTLKGGNSRLDEIQAAVLRIKLKYLDQWNDERRRKARIYTERLSPYRVICPSERPAATHVYHLYVIRTEKRNSLQTFLKEKGVETLIHYPIPIHRQEAFKELKYRRGALPVTEKVAREILSLPFSPELTEEEAKEVGQHIERFFGDLKVNNANDSE